MKYLAFDLEIAKGIPEGETDWKAHRPLGITCAAAASSDGGLWNWWAQDPRGKFRNKMSEFQCVRLVVTLNALVSEGYTLLTWNGLGFVFDVLAEESGLHAECKALDLNHIDMIRCLGLPDKPKGKAAALWADGEYHKVLDYTSWSVKNILGVAASVEAAERIAQATLEILRM